MATTEVIINDAYIPLLDDRSKYLHLYGGGGTGKSIFAAQKVILRAFHEPNTRMLVVRKVKEDLRESVFSNIKNRIIEMGLFGEFEIHEQYKRFKHIGGGELICIGLNDPERIKSFDNPTGSWCEEATELTEEDFDQIDLRIKDGRGSYVQNMLTYNPIDKRHWIKYRFHDPPDEQKKKDGIRIFKTVHEHNHYLTDDYMQRLEMKKHSSPNMYRIMRLGEWGVPEVKRPYAYNFNMEKHVRKIEPHPLVPIRFAFDFNLDPFVCTVSQQWRDKNGYHKWFIAEHVIEQNGSIDAMCRLIATRYTKKQLATAFFTGDSSERKRSIVLDGKSSAWDLLNSYFRIGSRLELPKRNPSGAQQIEEVNTILYHHPDICFDEGMSLTISELQFTEADEAGNIVKGDRKHFERRSDALDCIRYDLNAWLKDFTENIEKYIALKAA
jgi:phage terminase large subunit